MAETLTDSPGDVQTVQTVQTTGNAHKWTDAEWLLLLSLEAVDFDAAIESFRTSVSPAYAGLIDGSGWTFDPQAMQYTRDASGKPLSDADLKAIMVLYVLSAEHAMQDAAAQMAEGTTPLDEWQLNAAEQIKNLYVASAIVAAGGVDHLQADDTDFIIGAPSEGFDVPIEIKPDTPPGGLSDAFARLQAFAAAVELKEDRANTLAAITNRGGLYAGPANGIFEAVKRAGWMRLTDVEVQERNILDDDPDVKHCRTTAHTDGCPEITRAGWAPIGTYALPGLRTCGARCRCRMDHRFVKKDERASSQPQ